MFLARLAAYMGKFPFSRPGDYDLNYELTSNVAAAASSSQTSPSTTQTSSGNHMNMSNMAGMAMSVKEASSPSPTNMSTNVNAGNNHAGMNTHTAVANSNNNNIKNMTQYQTAQALVGKAVEVFNKNLKSTASTSLKAANTKIENDLNQLKAAIDNKAPFMDVMKIVHIQIHPTLITDYNLQLKSFQ